MIQIKEKMLLISNKDLSVWWIIRFDSNRERDEYLEIHRRAVASMKEWEKYQKSNQHPT